MEVPEEWEGTLDQICEAIANGKVTTIGLYFREAAGVLSRLADVLDPPQDSKGWQLEFIRKGRGRPRDNSMSRMFEESRRAMELWEETHKAGGQQEIGNRRSQREDGSESFFALACQAENETRS